MRQVAVAEALIAALGVRGVGHSYVQEHGWRNVHQRAVVVSDVKLPAHAPEAISTQRVAGGHLLGSQLPVVIEHETLRRLLVALVDEAEAQRRRADALWDALEAIERNVHTTRSALCVGTVARAEPTRTA